MWGCDGLVEGEGEGVGDKGEGGGGGFVEYVSYVLHAFDANLGAFHGLFSPRLEVDLAYVMRRESNFARGPAVKHAIEAGLLPEVKLEG